MHKNVKTKNEIVLYIELEIYQIAKTEQEESVQCTTFWLEVFYEHEIKYERNDNNKKNVIFSLFPFIIILWDEEMASLFTICLASNVLRCCCDMLIP